MITEKQTFERLQEIRAMLTVGTHQTSYEGKIVDKMDELLAQFTGPETIRVEFHVSRSDLLQLFQSQEYGSRLEAEADSHVTSTLLSYVLQHILYDSADGPQLEGNYTLLLDDTETPKE